MVPFDEASAHRVGALLARSGTTDVVDASVVELATTTRGEIVTMDPLEIEHLVSASAKRIHISRQ